MLSAIGVWLIVKFTFDPFFVPDKSSITHISNIENLAFL
jgi:hypothetical protein